MKSQRDDILSHTPVNAARPYYSPYRWTRWSVLAALVATTLALLICTFFETAFRPDSNQIVLLTRLPTLTPTASITPAAAARVAEPAGATPTPISAPVHTVTRGTAGWSFIATRLDADQENNLLMLRGELINDTGSGQQLALVSGTFYDDQGQIIGESTYNYNSPVKVVPSGGRIPFELVVHSLQRTANYDLWATSMPASYSPRQDFEFLDVNEHKDGETHCLTGSLQNLGGGLKDHVVIIAIWYDAQGNVLKSSNHYETKLTELPGDKPLGFEICADALTGDIVRYELRAWGR
jgi:hypothetical protein